MHGAFDQRAQYNEFIESRPKSWALVCEWRPSRYSPWAKFNRENLSSAESEEFSWCFRCVGGSTLPFVSLYSPFIVVFLLLTGVPMIGTCPIRPYLQLLGVVVRAEKYGRVRHRALNTIKAAFPYTLSFYLLSFSTFVLSLPCGAVWSLAPDGLLPLLPSNISIRGGFFHCRGGVFPWTEPLAQYRYWNGPIGLFPPTVLIMLSLCLSIYNCECL